jgi:Flp pilus assembly protein TadD
LYFHRDRADFLRDLSVSYNKMGDLLRALGQGEQARASFQKSLDIAERLARQEPGRTDLQADLVVSLWRLGDRGSLQRALNILLRLDQEQKLTAEQRGWIPGLEAAARNSDP